MTQSSYPVKQTQHLNCDQTNVSQQAWLFEGEERCTYRTLRINLEYIIQICLDIYKSGTFYEKNGATTSRSQ